MNNKIRLNGKCFYCAKKYSIAASVSWTERHDVILTADSGRTLTPIILNSDERAHFQCDHCRAWVLGRRVSGKVVPDKTCDKRCQRATGHDCECACGGANHGAAHAA